jgi:hypothetical protein
VRSEIVLADVRLHLDDPPDPAGRAGIAVADQPRPDERRRDVERRPAEELPKVDQLPIDGGFE